MKFNLLRTFLLLAFILQTTIVFSQTKNIQIEGRVVEQGGQQPIEFATVMVADAESQIPITGVTTDMDGNFQVETESPNFYVEVTFIGFKTTKIEDIKVVNGKADLGTIV